MAERVKLPLPPEHADLPWSTERLRDDEEGFIQAFRSLNQNKIDCDELPIEVVPRLPGTAAEVVPFDHPRSKRNMNILPERWIVKRPLLDVLRRSLDANIANWPEENTFFQNVIRPETGAPLAYWRADCGLEIRVDPKTKKRSFYVPIGEWEEQGAFIGTPLQRYHKRCFQQFVDLKQGLAHEYGRPLYRTKFHDNDLIYGDTAYAIDHPGWLAEWDTFDSIDDVTLIASARRWEPGSKAFLQRTDPANVLTGSKLRDYKGTLAVNHPALNHGILLEDASVAARAIATLREHGLAGFAKNVYSARTEGAAAGQTSGKKGKGQYTPRGLEAKLRMAQDDGMPADMAVLLQRHITLCTQADLGSHFEPEDYEEVKRHIYGRYKRFRAPASYIGQVDKNMTDYVTGEDVFDHLPIPGNEEKYFVWLRLFWVYDLAKGDYVCVGGLANLRTNPNLIHGASDVWTVLLEVEDYEY